MLEIRCYHWFIAFEVVEGQFYPLVEALRFEDGKAVLELLALVDVLQYDLRREEDMDILLDSGGLVWRLT